MSFARRKSLVQELKRAADESAADQARHCIAIRHWKQQTLATPGTLAWAFAAGVIVASGHNKGGRKSSGKGSGYSNGTRRRARRKQLVRNMLGAANTGILAWRLFGRAVDVG